MEETMQLPLRIEDQGLVYEDRNQKVRKVQAFFEGFTKEYLVSDRGQRAALMIVRERRVLLARQYRLLVNAISLEIPGGKVDDGEDPCCAAVRECWEETGVRGVNPKLLVAFHPGLDISNNYTQIYYAHECEANTTADVSRSSWIPLDECVSMIGRQEIVDALSVLGILAYRELAARATAAGQAG